MDEFLRHTDVIDWRSPAVETKAASLRQGQTDEVGVARACFEWVRDHIRHSGDYRVDVTTWRASDVLTLETGWCFAKSHLLAALLRANGLPAGLCYQRLCRDVGSDFTLHGLNAVQLPGLGWYRIDPRGNKPGVDAQFDPPDERLAWPAEHPGEVDCRHVWSEPIPTVLECLKAHEGWEAVEANLPDLQLF